MIRALTLTTTPDVSPPAPMVAVDRAVGDIRRGGVVVVRARDGEAILAQAAEAVTPAGLTLLAQAAGRAASLAITGRRAAALGLCDSPAIAEEPCPEVVVVSAGDHLDADMVLTLAQPGSGRPVALPPSLAATSVAATGTIGAAVRLTKLARLLPSAVTAPLAGEDPLALAARRGFAVVDVADILAYDQVAARSLRPVSEARVPLAGAEDTRIVAFRPGDGGIEHLAIIIGEPTGDVPVLTRLHSECFTGDLLGSLRCDCGDQLRGAIEEIARAGSGVLLYLAQEGRGIGLVNKLRAYQLQDRGFDTLDANGQLGFDDDERIYLPAAEMLRQLGFSRVRLLTNNPRKVESLARHDIEVVERVPHVFPANDHNQFYLRTKATKGGHLF